MNQLETQTEPAIQAMKRDPLPTLWEATDEMWNNLFLPLLTQLDPPHKMGRPRVDQRKCLDGMIYRARTGCQWNYLPEKFGSDSTVHRTVYRWDKKGVFDKLWALLISHCEELQAVHWEWQAADGCLNKARFIGKKGAKAERARHRKTEESKTEKSKTEKSKTTLRAKASVAIPATAANWASNRACLLRSEADRLLSALRART